MRVRHTALRPATQDSGGGRSRSIRGPESAVLRVRQSGSKKAMPLKVPLTTGRHCAMNLSMPATWPPGPNSDLSARGASPPSAGQ